MNDCCILFSYIRPSGVAKRHYELIRQHNPGHVIVPVTAYDLRLSDDSVCLAGRPSRWDLSDMWRGCDSNVYRWWPTAPPARRYIYLEYDSYCTVGVREVFDSVWDADFACREFQSPIHSDNRWGGEVSALAEVERRHASWLWPLNGFLASRDCLEAVVRGVSSAPVFCEVRLATAVAAVGAAVATMPWWVTNSSSPVEVGPEPGIYHPVKTAVDAVPVL